jgi:hypothetical protein
LQDLWYNAQKKAKNYAKDKGLPSSEDMIVWRDFKPMQFTRVSGMLFSSR